MVQYPQRHFMAPAQFIKSCQHYSTLQQSCRGVQKLYYDHGIRTWLQEAPRPVINKLRVL